MPIHWNYLRTKRFLQIATIVAFSALLTLVIVGSGKRSVFNKKSIVFRISDSSEKSLIVKAAKDAFNLYEKYCSDFDEVMPKTHECLNNYGFYATAVESLETLYLLGLKEQFNKAKKIVINNLIPSKISWVNRQEFWSRCIGSLIGVYQLSGDAVFLERAQLLADKLITLQSRQPRFSSFVNFQLNKVEASRWRNETISLSDITAGLPEIAALYNITGSIKYITSANTIVAAIPDLRNKMKSFVNYKNMKLVEDDKSLYEMDGHSIDLYNSLATAYLITKNKAMFKKLKMLKKSFGNPGNAFSSCDILETMRLMKKVDIPLQVGDIDKFIISTYGNLDVLFKNQGTRMIHGFNFPSKPFRAMLYSDRIGDFVNSYMESFEKFEYQGGYSSKMHTSKGRWIPTGIQDSSFLGEWLKLGAEYLLNDETEIRNGIVNSRGHFLKLGSDNNDE